MEGYAMTTMKGPEPLKAEWDAHAKDYNAKAAREAHQHEYVPDTRPDWGGVLCRICGFRVPQSQVHVRAVQERLVPADEIHHEQRCQAWPCVVCRAARRLAADA